MQGIKIQENNLHNEEIPSRKKSTEYGKVHVTLQPNRTKNIYCVNDISKFTLYVRQKEHGRGGEI